MNITVSTNLENKLESVKTSPKHNEPYKNTDRGYENALGSLSEIYSDSKIEDEAKNLISAYDKNNDQPENWSDITPAYSAFFSLIIFYRHQFDRIKLDELWNMFSWKFCDYNSYSHLVILHDLFNLDNFRVNEIKKSLDIAKENAQKYPDNPGINHALADLFASVCERYENDPEDLNSIKLKYNGCAVLAAQKAIDYEEDTAVFYCTLGRIISVCGESYEDFDNADKYFNTAVEKERSGRKDYGLRLNKYNYYRNINRGRRQSKHLQEMLKAAEDRICLQEKVIQEQLAASKQSIESQIGTFDSRLNEKSKEIESQTKTMKEQLETNEKNVESIKGSVISNVETVGIFSGVVSFVIGSLSITTNSAVESGLLILTLMGCLTAALTVFSLLLHMSDNEEQRKRRIKATIWVIAFSLILSFGSIVLAHFIVPKV